MEPRPALEELHIRDIGVIEDVTLELGAGLNVLTGETGAGKTMIVAALELLLGARADSDQVRVDATRALVEGRIHPAPAAAREWLDDGDDELVVARELGRGRSKARLSGRLAPASALGDVVGAVVEVHGQQDSARLASPAVQRELLDRSGGEDTGAALADYQREYRRWRDLTEELEALRTGQRDRAREIDRLTFELSEIDAVDPVAGEDEDLEAELSRLEHAETLIDAAAAAASALTAEGGARDALGVGVEALRGVAGLDRALTPLQERLEGIAAEAQDIGMELDAYRDTLPLDPERLQGVRERRMRLSALTRKYGADAAAVAGYAVQARERLAVLEGGDERVETLEGDVAEAAADVAAAAGRLRDARRRAADRLAADAHRHLADLAMGDAQMRISLEPADPGPDGADRVTFMLAANPGQPPLPLAKAASGGERSRVALAIRLALAGADDTPVFVFDEVDAGVGGETALAVGAKLSRLAQGRQVLCVTHLAQLAAYADAHFVVAKDASGGRTSATVRRVDEDERVAELSRMLSGARDSAAAARHAEELLATARDGAPGSSAPTH
jgi:DNA repair protein RecN (Recombination protein N)